MHGSNHWSHSARNLESQNYHWNWYIKVPTGKCVVRFFLSLSHPLLHSEYSEIKLCCSQFEHTLSLQLKLWLKWMLQMWIFEYSQTNPWTRQWHRNSSNMLYFRPFISSNRIFDVIRRVPNSFSRRSHTIAFNCNNIMRNFVCSENVFIRDRPKFPTDFKILTALGIFRPHPPTLKS